MGNYLKRYLKVLEKTAEEWQAGRKTGQVTAEINFRKGGVGKSKIIVREEIPSDEREGTG